MSVDALAPAASPPAFERRHVRAIAAVVALLGILFFIYWPTFDRMLNLWLTSDTYAHGLFVIPISIYIIWSERSKFRHETIRPDFTPLALMLLNGAVWGFAHAAAISVVEQYAFIAMIPLIIWAVFGWNVIRHILFPLAFLLLAVPVGDEFRPYLIDFVADFVTSALRITGIPVYREGNFFIIPSGTWNVVQGCSGLRYLMATLTVGTLYAYFTYVSPWRRLAFIGISLLVALLGNAMRAYMIVMIAHLSGMTLALGIDHYIYGWVFFGILIFTLMWVGAIWRESTTQTDSNAEPTASGSGDIQPVKHSRLAVVVVVSLLLIVLWPGLDAWARMNSRAIAKPASFPAEVNGWSFTAAEVPTSWVPHIFDADSVMKATYSHEGTEVGVLIFYYANQRQDQELINAANALVKEKDPDWRLDALVGTPRSAANGSISVEEYELLARSGKSEAILWQTYWVNGEVLVNPMKIKIQQSLDGMFGRGQRAARLVIIAPAVDDSYRARAIAAEFGDAVLPALLDIFSGSPR